MPPTRDNTQHSRTDGQLFLCLAFAAGKKNHSAHNELGNACPEHKRRRADRGVGRIDLVKLGYDADKAVQEKYRRAQKEHGFVPAALAAVGENDGADDAHKADDSCDAQRLAQEDKTENIGHRHAAGHEEKRVKTYAALGKNTESDQAVKQREQRHRSSHDQGIGRKLNFETVDDKEYRGRKESVHGVEEQYRAGGCARLLLILLLQHKVYRQKYSCEGDESVIEHVVTYQLSCLFSERNKYSKKRHGSQ